MMTRTELQSIIEEANNNSPKWVRVFLGGNSDRILVEGEFSARRDAENHDRAHVKATIKAIKNTVGETLQARFPERVFLHAKFRKCRFWTDGITNMGVFHASSMLCGVAFKLTEDEHRMILLGASKQLFK